MKTVYMAGLIVLTAMLGRISAQDFQVTRIDGWSGDQESPYPYVVALDSTTLHVGYFRLSATVAKVSTDKGLTWQDGDIFTTADGPAILYLVTPDSVRWYRTYSGNIYSAHPGFPLEKLTLPVSTYRVVAVLGKGRCIVVDTNRVTHLIESGIDRLMPDLVAIVGRTWVFTRDGSIVISWDEGMTWANPVQIKDSDTGIYVRPTYIDSVTVASIGFFYDGHYVGSQYVIIIRRDGSVIRHKGEHGEEGNRTGGSYGWFHRFPDGTYAVGPWPRSFDYYSDEGGWQLYGNEHGGIDPTTVIAATTPMEVYLVYYYTGGAGYTLWRVSRGAPTDIRTTSYLPPKLWYADDELCLSNDLLNLSPSRVVVYDLTGRQVLQILNPGPRIRTALPKGVFVISIYFNSPRSPLHQRIAIP